MLICSVVSTELDTGSPSASSRAAPALCLNATDRCCWLFGCHGAVVVKITTALFLFHKSDTILS